MQEYTENQCYLRALNTVNFEHNSFPIEASAESVVRPYRHAETMEQVLSEPVGNLLFRYHLMAVDALEYLMFLNEIEVCYRAGR